MGFHYDSPEYLDILLMARRYNVNILAKPGTGSPIKFELSDFERDICRRLEKTGYTQFQKDIDNLVGALLKLRRSDSKGKQRGQNTQQLSENLAKILKATTKSSHETNQKPPSTSTKTVAGKPKHENAVAGPSTPKAKPQATPQPAAKTAFDPMASKHNEKKFRFLNTPTKATISNKPPPKTYKPKTAPTNAPKPPNRPVRTYTPTRRDPNLPKTPLKHYAPKDLPERLLTPHQVPTITKPASAMLPSIKGPPSTDADGVRRSVKIRNAAEEAREKAARLASEVRKG